jgi:hypothetical protein
VTTETPSGPEPTGSDGRTDADAPTRGRWAAGRAASRLVGLRFVVAIAPVFIGLTLLRRWLGQSVDNYLPVQSDELSLWLQIASFSQVGFDNGYYTYQEHTPPMATGYGPWGPALPVLYGSVLALTGLSMTAVVWLNAIVFVLLVAGALSVARTDLRQTLLVGAVLATSGPVLVYVPTGMQETIHHALAVVLAVGFHRLARVEPAARLRTAIWLCGAITFAALLRPTWSLLLFAAALLAMRGERRPGRLVATIATSTAGAAALFMLFPSWAAPVPYVYAYQIRHAPTFGGKLQLFGENVLRNVQLVFDPDTWVLTISLVHVHALVVIALGAVSVLVWFRWRDRVRVASGRPRRGSTHQEQIAVLASTVALALLPPLTFIICFYDIANGSRVLTAHVLFVAVLLCVTRLRLAVVVPVILIACNLAIGPWLRDDFRLRNGVNFSSDPQAVTAFRAAIAGHVKYQDGANPWCNTMLVSTDYGFFTPLVAVPHGFGLSVDFSHRFHGPVRSAYVVAKDRNAALLPRGANGFVRLADAPPYGVLYRNLDSPCFQK